MSRRRVFGYVALMTALALGRVTIATDGWTATDFDLLAVVLAPGLLLVAQIEKAGGWLYRFGWRWTSPVSMMFLFGLGVVLSLAFWSGLSFAFPKVLMRIR